MAFRLADIVELIRKEHLKVVVDSLDPNLRPRPILAKFDVLRCILILLDDEKYFTLTKAFDLVSNRHFKNDLSNFDLNSINSQKILAIQPYLLSESFDFEALKKTNWCLAYLSKWVKLTVEFYLTETNLQRSLKEKQSEITKETLIN